MIKNIKSLESCRGRLWDDSSSQAETTQKRQGDTVQFRETGMASSFIASVYKVKEEFEGNWNFFCRI